MYLHTYIHNIIYIFTYIYIYTYNVGGGGGVGTHQDTIQSQQTIQSPKTLCKAPTDYTKPQHLVQNPNILDKMFTMLSKSVNKYSFNII